MSETPNEVFVVCSKEQIRPGQARGFSLLQAVEDGQQPLHIVIVRITPHHFAAYRNACPHQASWLNIGAGAFLTEDGKRLRCSRHGAEFDMASGSCVAGPCVGERLESLALQVLGRDVCLSGLKLVEDDSLPDLEDEFGEMMEITISAD